MKVADVSLARVSALTTRLGQLGLLVAAACESGALLGLLAVPAVLARDFDALSRTGLVLTGAAFGASLIAIPSARWLAGTRVTRWLARDAHAFGFFGRLAVCVLAGLAGFWVYKSLLDALAIVSGSSDPYAGMSRPLSDADIGTWIVGIGLLLAWPACMYLFVLGQFGALTLASTAIATIAAVVSKGGACR